MIRTDPSPDGGLTLVDRVTDQLRTGICCGQYAQGQRLIETALVSELGVSRGPLRESLRRLAGEGLVFIEPHRGAIVRRFSCKEVSELFLLRERVESLAAFIAASNGSGKSETGKFDSVLDDMESLLKRGRVREYFGKNSLFHEAVARCAGNYFITEFVMRLEQPLLRFQYEHIDQFLVEQQSASQSLLEHRMIADAIIRGDASAAETAMRQHIRRTAERFAEDFLQETPAES